ncbi:ACT domain-containing protein [Candidatus Saccharibacteria bacterium]|nr:ACT domain-containing protein [Candidatus Saccharibacteria bacterium]
MAKFKIRTYNKIAQVGLDKFSDAYQISDSVDDADAIMLRSQNLHDEKISDSVLAVGRAGAGVNNIPITDLTERGVIVFNAPGANANSVKELVLAGLLISARNIAGAIKYTEDLKGDKLKEQVEAGKKQFAGSELSGKTLGVIGLGSIGYRVANSGVDLGMKVLGYDPAMTIQNAWQLSAAVQRVEDLEQLVKESDFITIHVPLLEQTKHLISSELIGKMRKSASLINFSRDEIVDEKQLVKTLAENKVRNYITDFPNPITLNQPGVVSLPHLGASTAEAEDNCAIMVAEQLQDYLENGNIQYSVNFPSAVLARKGSKRVTLAHKNKPGVVASITSIFSDAGINIVELLNKSRGDVAYSIIDIEPNGVPEMVEKKLQSIPELLKLRTI